MNGGYKISILFFLILMMIVVPLGLTLLHGSANAPQVINQETVRTVSDYQQRATLALQATAEDAPSSMKRLARLNAPPRQL